MHHGDLSIHGVSKASVGSPHDNSAPVTPPTP